MARARRSNDWGFPRWRGYGARMEAQSVRMCDRSGCEEPGDRPAPKAPNSPERWYFCERHAAEYNSRWDYFAGLDEAEAAAREQRERADAAGYRQSAHHGWGGPGDGRWSRDELNAFKTLGLDEDADFETVKAAWRTLAKENHPDMKPGDTAAYVRFQTIQAAFAVLRSAEERRLATSKPRRKTG